MNMPRDSQTSGLGSFSIGEHLRALGALAPDDERRVLDEQARSGLPFGEAALALGLIDAAGLREALARQHDFLWPLPPGRVAREVVVARQPHSEQAEPFRDLRTRLQAQWRQPHGGARALAVVSADRADGRSLVAANLAVAFAQANARTLLIDLDFRQPVQQGWFACPRRLGVSSVLIGRCELADALADPPHPMLTVLGAGGQPPNPQELLGPGALGLLMASLRTRFDVIVADSPAWSQASDALLVAAQCGQALLVNRPTCNDLQHSQALVRALQAGGVELLGATLNRH